MTEADFINAAAKALRNSTTPAMAATRMHTICRVAAKAWGMKPDIECALRSPEQSKAFGGGSNWYVCFEAGPHNWAVAVSEAANDKVIAEPYYGFDLSFYDV